MPVTVRTIVLKIHLYVGLIGAVFLLVLSLTGAVMAFEHDIEHWVHPTRYRVTPGPALAEDELVRIAERQFAPAVVSEIQIPAQPGIAQTMSMTGGAAVYIDPGTGTINGRTVG